MFTYKLIINVNQAVDLRWLMRSTKEIDHTCFNDALVVLYPRRAYTGEGSVISMCKEIFFSIHMCKEINSKGFKF